jgi:oligosaccharide repeat unit polymerase
MTAVGVFAWTLVAVLIALLVLRKGDPLAPARTMALVWAGAIALCELKLSAYQHQWSFYSWVVLLVGPAAFIVGVAAISWTNVTRPLLPLEEIRKRLVREAGSRFDEGKFFWTIMVLFAAYVAAYAIEVVIEGTVPMFSARPDILRVEFGVFGLHLIVNGMMGIVLLSMEYLFLMRPTGGRRWAVIAVVVFSVLTYALMLQRYTFFVVGVIVLAMAFYTTRWVRARNILPFAGVFVILLFLINQVRAARYVQEYVYYVSKMRFSKNLWFLAEPYMYITMNLENFARAVDKLDHHMYGYFLLDPLLALVGLKHWLAEYFSIERLPYLISGYNTFTFHWWYYYDFGVLGVALLPFLTGLVTAYVYGRLRTRPDPLTMVMYASCVLLMVISYFMNPLNRLDFVSNLVLIWFVHRFVIGRKASPVAGESGQGLQPAVEG